jgi:hypothetical protein
MTLMLGLVKASQRVLLALSMVWSDYGSGYKNIFPLVLFGTERAKNSCKCNKKTFLVPGVTGNPR